VPRSSFYPRRAITQECEKLAMFEQLDNPGESPQVKVSLAMSLGILAAYIVGAFVAVCLFVILGEKPFGIQIATVITYTHFVFWYVFFPTKGMLTQYSLRNKLVQRRLPFLLAIHGAFLISIIVVQTIWFAVKFKLPTYWLAERGRRGQSLYEWAMMLFFVALFFTQVWISRGILDRSLRPALDE
jgi:hypothetical protein